MQLKQLGFYKLRKSKRITPPHAPNPSMPDTKGKNIISSFHRVSAFERLPPRSVGRAVDGAELDAVLLPLVAADVLGGGVAGGDLVVVVLDALAVDVG